MKFDSSSANELLLTLEQKYLHAAKVVDVGGQQFWRNRMCKATLPGFFGPPLRQPVIIFQDLTSDYCLSCTSCQQHACTQS